MHSFLLKHKISPKCISHNFYSFLPFFQEGSTLHTHQQLSLYKRQNSAWVRLQDKERSFFNKKKNTKWRGNPKMNRDWRGIPTVCKARSSFGSISEGFSSFDDKCIQKNLVSLELLEGWGQGCTILGALF